MLSQPCEESKNHVKQLQLYLPRNILEFHEIWTSVWNWSIIASWEEGITQLKIVSSFWIESSLVHGGSLYAVNSYWSMADVADTSAGEKLHCCAFKYMVILSWLLHQNPKKVYLCFCPKQTFLDPFHQPLQSSCEIYESFSQGFICLRVDSHILLATECNTHIVWSGFMFVMGKGKWGQAESTVGWRGHKCLILDGDFSLCWKPTSLLFAIVVEDFM